MMPIELHRAIVEEAKVRDYLLSASHPVGRFKANFFISLGYTQSEWWVLRDDLLALVQQGPHTLPADGAHGRMLEIEGVLGLRPGRRVLVKTVWIVRHGEDFPRLVTAFPR